MTLPFSRKDQTDLAALADRARDAGEWDAAAALYRTALARDFRNPPLWVQYGHALKESGALRDAVKLARAEAAYRRALTYAPRVADTHLQLGHVLKLQGRADDAKAAYLRAQALDPESAAARGELRALGWDEDGGAELQAALAALAAAATPRRRPSLIEQADAARDAALWTQAARCYRALLDRDPGNAAIWVQYGHALKEDGNLKDPARLAEAEAAYRRALALAPRAADTHLQLGHALKLQGKTEEAEAAYLRAFALGKFSRVTDELRTLRWSEAYIVELMVDMGAAVLPCQRPARALPAPLPPSTSAGIGSASNEAISPSERLSATTSQMISVAAEFDAEFYLAKYGDVKSARLDPFHHFMSHGWREGRDPNGWFSTNYYLMLNPDVRDAGINPFYHYIDVGKAEGRNTSETPSVLGSYKAPFNIFDAEIVLKLPVASGAQNHARSTSKVRIAVHLHVFYPDLLSDLIRKLELIPEGFDIYITTDTQTKIENIHAILSDFYLLGAVDIRAIPNRGRDVAPFFIEFANIIDKYEFLLHLHTKKTPQNTELGHVWLNHLLDRLLRDTTYIQSILTLFDAEPQCGLIVPEPLEQMKPLVNWGRNFEVATDLLAKIGVAELSRDQLPLPFPVGNMFWCRPEALSKLFNGNLGYEMFPPEPLDEDGTLAHALERATPYVARAAGFHHRTIAPLRADKTFRVGDDIELTVIIPAYNAGKWLHHAIQSVICQEIVLHNAEIIIVNNNSQDNTREISDFYQRAFPNVLCFDQVKQGAGAARNFGMDMARGRHVMFLDADDILEVAAIERLMRRRMDADLVTSQLCTFTETNVNGPVPYFVSGTVDMTEIEHHPTSLPACVVNNLESIYSDFGPCAKIYSVEFLKKNNIRFLEGVNFEDNYFVYKAYLNASVIAVEGSATYFYRKFTRLAGTTQSTSVAPGAVADQIRVLNDIVDLLDREVTSPFLRDLALRKLATKLAWEAPLAKPIPPQLLLNRSGIAHFFRRIDVERILSQWPDSRYADDALQLRRLNAAMEE